MSYGAFIDKNIKPDQNIINNSLSTAQTSFNELTGFIENNYKSHGELKFYGKNYGWAIRFNRSGKSLIALYPGNNEFTAQVILNDHQVEAALDSDIDFSIKKIISETPEIKEGKWIFIKISTEIKLSDIKKLISIRETHNQCK